MKLINSTEIAVIIQGSIISKETYRCIKSIRKFLPKAEVILSTWKNQDVQNLDYDKLILSEDPGETGSHYYKDKTVPYNFNRQLISTLAGLKATSKIFAIKIRSDFYLRNAGFLRYFDSFPLCDNKWKLFNHRVIVPSVYSRRFSEETGFPLLYHPSDFFFFGLTKDLLDYFSSCRLIDKTQGSDWHYKYPDRKPYISETGRYTAEQQFCVEWLKQHNIDVNYDDFSDWNEETFGQSDKILFNNFIFLNPKSIGLKSKKHGDKLCKAQYNPWYGLITQQFFEYEYKKSYDNNFSPSKYKKNKYLYYILRLLNSIRSKI